MSQQGRSILTCAREEKGGAGELLLCVSSSSGYLRGYLKPPEGAVDHWISNRVHVYDLFPSLNQIVLVS